MGRRQQEGFLEDTDNKRSDVITILHKRRMREGGREGRWEGGRKERKWGGIKSEEKLTCDSS